MDKIGEAWFKYVESPLSMLGLMTSKISRFSFFTIAAGSAIWLMKPRGLFDKDGKAKEWQVWSDKADSVPMNWVVFSLFIGGLSILFI